MGAASTKPDYSVKNIEPIVIGTDVQARIFTLAPGEFIPWHRHSEGTDHYFVLRGTLSIRRDDNDGSSDGDRRGWRGRDDDDNRRGRSED